MVDILKLGGDYFKFNQSFFQTAKVQDPKTYLIGVTLILSWLAGVPVLCGALYVLDSLKTRLTRNVHPEATPTATKTGTVAQASGVQPATNTTGISTTSSTKYTQLLFISFSGKTTSFYYDPEIANVKSLTKFIRENSALFNLPASGEFRFSKLESTEFRDLGSAELLKTLKDLFENNTLHNIRITQVKTTE